MLYSQWVIVLEEQKRHTKKENQRYFVVKANDLIRKTRYNLTTQQQKLVLFAISKIRPNDPPETIYELNIEEICDACGLEIDGGGYYYKAIKDDLVKLTTRLWIKMPDNVEATVAWISDAEIIPLSGKVYIKFHPKMAPYLFELQERYTMYHLENVLVFKSRHSIRLYELLRSYITNKMLDEGIEKNVSYKLDELRDILAVDKYPRWADLDRFVIRKAIEEINLCSDEIHIEYETYRGTGRNIETINFIITPARAKQIMRAHMERDKRI